MSQANHAPSAISDYVTRAIPDDERLWVPQAENVWFRPLLLNRVAGEWCNLLRVRKSGVLSRHRHPAPVHGFVIKGSWRYLEHDWIATAGSFIFEPAGEAHTLVVPEDATEPAIILFVVAGALVFVNDDGEFLMYEDGFSMLELTREHYRGAGIDLSRADALIR